MSKTRPFTFRIHAADFFTTVQNIPAKQRGQFLSQMAIDLITLTPTLDYTKQVISETVEYIAKQSEHGRKGGRPKKTDPLPTLNGGLTDPEATPKPKEEEEEEKHRGKPRWFPPTLDDVKRYCAERGKSVDPESWYDHYSSNGWLVGKNKMKDWQAAVRTWERTSFGNKPQQQLGLGVYR